MAKISIIIPLYNKANYICRALDSVFAQTFDNYEVIVVNDGSTDNGPDMVRKYNDKRLKMISQKNLGPGAARNRGLKECHNPYVTFLDADDEWLPRFLETSVFNLDAHQDCAFSVNGFYIGKDKSLWPGTKMLQVTKGTWRLPVDMDPSLMGAAVAANQQGAVLCRRCALLAFCGFYEKRCKYGEDLYLWLQLILRDKIFRDPEPLLWQHTEASELVHNGRAINRKWLLMPYLTDTYAIRQNCPVEYKPLLERFLAHQALHNAHECATEGNMATARWLVKNYPLMKIWQKQYLKLRYKIMFPETAAILRRIKHRNDKKETQLV